MRRLCRECGGESCGRGACPHCGSASVYGAADCPACGGVREAKDLLCEECAAAVRGGFRSFLRGLGEAERRYLDEAVDGRGLEEFW